MLIPIRIESLFDRARCVGLFRVDSDECEWVGKAKDVTFDQAICSNDYEESVRCFDAFHLKLVND